VLTVTDTPPDEDDTVGDHPEEPVRVKVIKPGHQVAVK